MYKVSNDYKKQINNGLRNPSHMRVRFGITDPDAIGDSTISDTDHTVYSDSAQIKIETDIPLTYDTLELNKFILDSTHMTATESYGHYQGYVSESMSDENCDYTTPPKIIVDYNGYYEFAGFTLRFDAVRNDFSSMFSITCYNDLVEVYTDTFVINDYDFMVEQAIPLHNRVEITFLKSALPYKRVRLHYLGFGIERTLEDDVIVNTTSKNKIDLMSTTLPSGDFKFTFLDVKNEYNPDNPSGLYKYLEELQSVKFEYGYELNDGTTEWVLGGYNYTTGEVSIDSSGKISQVSFNTSNSIAYLSEVYIKGVYNPSGISLYDLAVDVMAGTNILYDFDDSLKTILTTTPMLKLPRRECLQIIANASQSILDVNRDGKVRIYKIDVLAQPNDFKFDFANMYNTPIVTKIPTLKNLNTSYYEHTPKVSSENISEISVNTSTDTEYYLEYELSTDVSASVDGTLVIVGTPKYYAHGCLITLNGVGKVTITGKPIETSENTVSKIVGQKGEDCTIKNELITSSDNAFSYANWSAEMLALKNEYSFDNRGFPELDESDLIGLETLYTENLKVIVTENNINYNGTLSAKTKVIFTNQ